MTRSNPHVLLPVANEEDARRSCESILAHLDRTVTLVVVHVIQTGGGHFNKAPLSAQEALADETFAAVASLLDHSPISYVTEKRYGTDIVTEILAVAEECDVDYIVFTPRESGRLSRILGADLSDTLIQETSRPVIILPRLLDPRGDST